MSLGRFRPVVIVNNGQPLGADTSKSQAWFGTYVPTDQEVKENNLGVRFIMNDDHRWGRIHEMARVEEIDYICGKWEIGKIGNLHFHFFVKFYKQIAESTARRLLHHSDGQYLAPARAVDASIKYVCKPEGAISDIWEHGSFVGQGHRTDLEIIADHIKTTGCSEREIANMFTHTYMRNTNAISKVVRMFEEYDRKQPPLVIVLYGVSGAGKTHMTARFDTGKNTYRKTMQGKWWDGYIGERTVCLDDFDPVELMDPVSHTVVLKEMLCAMDGYSDTRIQNKGGSALLRHETLFISSNFDPNNWFPFHQQKEAFFRRVHCIIRFKKKYDLEKDEGLKREDYVVEKFDLNTSSKRFHMNEPQMRWFIDFIKKDDETVIDIDGGHKIVKYDPVMTVQGLLTSPASFVEPENRAEYGMTRERAEADMDILRSWQPIDMGIPVSFDSNRATELVNEYERRHGDLRGRTLEECIPTPPPSPAKKSPPRVTLPILRASMD